MGGCRLVRQLDKLYCHLVMFPFLHRHLDTVVINHHYFSEDFKWDLLPPVSLFRSSSTRLTVCGQQILLAVLSSIESSCNALDLNTSLCPKNIWH